MARRYVLSSIVLASLIGASGCRLDPECFGKDECISGFVCSRGRCVLPDAAVSDSGAEDATVPPDAGTPDVGPTPDAGFPDFGIPDVGPPDFGFPDAARPDLGVPDGGLEDVGFLPATMPAGTDPLVGTSTPTAVIGGFRDLQNVTWRTSTNTLMFSDVEADTLYEVDPTRPATSLRLIEFPSGGANGAAEHPITGDTLVCEHAGRFVRVKPRGGGVDVPLVTDFHQYAFNSPNDLAIRSDGTVYFTDPPFGLNGRAQDLPFNGLFRAGTLTATLTVEWMGLPGVHAPDGVALSPDESRLYMSEVGGRVIIVFDVDAAGHLTNRRGFAITQGITPNGIAVDDDGNVYVATSIGIEVFADTGFEWGHIPFPGTVSDLTFAPPNRQRIYATTTSTVWAVDVPIPGPLR